MEYLYQYLSRDDLVKITDLSLKLINRAEEGNSVIYRGLVDILPLQGFIVCAINVFAPGDGLTRVMNLGYSSEWVDRYERCDYHRVDPIVTATEDGLMHWRKLFQSGKISKSQNEFIKEAADYGLIDGFSIRSVHDGKMHIASFAGNDMAKHPRHAAIATLMAPYFHMAAERSPRVDSSTPRLSVRERDVIHWVAAGKTNWEISHILKISERTVKFHLQNIMGKLHATTRSQAVAYALNLGVLEY